MIRGWIRVDGLLISDDLSMQALVGDIGARAAACLAAGCDVALHCNGDMDEMAAVADQTRDFDALAAAGRLGAPTGRGQLDAPRRRPNWPI